MTKSNYEIVLDAIKQRFYEEGELSKVRDIENFTGLSESQVRSVIDDMKGNQITAVYEGTGDPTIYATEQMYNSIISEVGEPKWISDYEFAEKSDLRDEVREANKTISEYQIYEQLLYATGDPLEDAIEASLRILEFDPETTEEDEDFFFQTNGIHVVGEAKGVKEEVEKADINQLGGWIENKIDAGFSASELAGVIFHNAHRHVPPGDRGDPLTQKAKEFIEIYSFNHISTYELYQYVKDVEEFEGNEDDKQQMINEIRSNFVNAITNE